jgi:hypothetical protein
MASNSSKAGGGGRKQEGQDGAMFWTERNGTRGALIGVCNTRRGSVIDVDYSGSGGPYAPPPSIRHQGPAGARYPLLRLHPLLSKR